MFLASSFSAEQLFRNRKNVRANAIRRGILFISTIYREWITYQIPNPVPIEKPFSKTHAPVFGIKVLEKFSPSRIHTNPTQTPPKIASSESQDGAMIDEVKTGFGLCPLVRKKNPPLVGRVYIVNALNYLQVSSITL